MTTHALGNAAPLASLGDRALQDSGVEVVGACILRADGTMQRGREDGLAIARALAHAHEDFAALEIHILDAQLATLLHAQPGAVEELRHELRDAGHFAQYAECITSREDVAQPVRTLRWRHSWKRRQRLA